MSSPLAEYYPGSKERRQVNHVPPNAASPAQEVVQNLGGGRTLTVQGIEVEFYSIGQLAAALNRKPGTIRMWEREGIIPPSGWTKAGRDRDPRGKRRLWTRKQVEGIVRIAIEEGVWHPADRISLQPTEFTRRVTALFETLRKAGIR